MFLCCVVALQNRDYDDEDYVAGVKSGRVQDKRTGMGGMGPMPAGTGLPGAGIARSSSDMSLAAQAAADPRMNKRLKNQMGGKPGEAAQSR